MTNPATFVVVDNGLPTIVLPPELQTKRWRTECRCGYQATARSEPAAATAGLEHWEYAHPPR